MQTDINFITNFGKVAQWVKPFTRNWNSADSKPTACLDGKNLKKWARFPHSYDVCLVSTNLK